MLKTPTPVVYKIEYCTTPVRHDYMRYHINPLCITRLQVGFLWQRTCNCLMWWQKRFRNKLKNLYCCSFMDVVIAARYSKSNNEASDGNCFTEIENVRFHLRLDHFCHFRNAAWLCFVVQCDEIFKMIRTVISRSAIVLCYSFDEQTVHFSCPGLDIVKILRGERFIKDRE